jgi:hypothetical protein
MNTFFDHHAAGDEARLLWRHFPGMGLPGESFRGFEGPQPGIPEIRRGVHPGGFHRGFSAGPMFEGGRGIRHGAHNVNARHFQNHQNFRHHSNFQHRWHARNHMENRFWYWHEQAPTWFHWRYDAPVQNIVDQPTAQHIHRYRNGALQSMRGMERHRHSELDRTNQSLQTLGVSAPRDTASNANLAYLASRMGFVDPVDFEDRFGYPALLGPRQPNPRNLPLSQDFYRQAQVERGIAAQRERTLRALGENYGAMPTAEFRGMDREAAILSDTIASWNSLSPEEQGDAYLRSLQGARAFMDVRPLQQQFLYDVGNQDPRTWSNIDL